MQSGHRILMRPGSILIAFGCLVFAAPHALGQATTKPAERTRQTDDLRKREEQLRLERAKRAALAEKNARMAGQDKGAAAARPAQAKPVQPAGQQVPKPTVVLKPGEKPGIKFDTLVYDFGRIRAGSDVVHDYWFTNTGNGPLEILQVKPS